jgi:hypothetical protein
MGWMVAALTMQALILIGSNGSTACVTHLDYGVCTFKDAPPLSSPNMALTNYAAIVPQKDQNMLSSPCNRYICHPSPHFHLFWSCFWKTTHLPLLSLLRIPWDSTIESYSVWSYLYSHLLVSGIYISHSSRHTHKHQSRCQPLQLPIQMPP